MNSDTLMFRNVPLLSGSSEETLPTFWQLLPVDNNLVRKCFLSHQFLKAAT